MMIWRHFIESRPSAFGIDCKIFKARYAVGGARQNFFDERRIEISVVSRSILLGIVPRQNKPKRFRAEVETVRHINDHGRGMREGVERLSRYEHAAQRCYRQVNANHLRNFSCPWACGVHHHRSAYIAFRGTQPKHVAVSLDRRRFSAAQYARAVLDSARR